MSPKKRGIIGGGLQEKEDLFVSHVRHYAITA